MRLPEFVRGGMVAKKPSRRYKGCLALIGLLLLIGSCGTKDHARPGFLTEDDIKEVDPWLLSPAMVEKLTYQARQGDGFSAWMLFCYYEVDHDPKARKYLVQAAELGVPEAQCSYYTVLVQSPDRATRENAVIWLKKAAQQGFEPARGYLENHDNVLRGVEKRHKAK